MPRPMKPTIRRVRVTSVGKPDAVVPHLRFNEQGQETERICHRACPWRQGMQELSASPRKLKLNPEAGHRAADVQSVYGRTVIKFPVQITIGNNDLKLIKFVTNS